MCVPVWVCVCVFAAVCVCVFRAAHMQIFVVPVISEKAPKKGIQKIQRQTKGLPQAPARRVFGPGYQQVFYRTDLKMNSEILCSALINRKEQL